MNELNNFEVTPKGGHYETIKEYYKEIPTIDKQGNQIDIEKVLIGTDVKWVSDDPEELKKQQDNERLMTLKAELAKIKEDIEQEVFGLIRDDYAEKKARAAEIINELRVVEGKEPREVKTD